MTVGEIATTMVKTPPPMTPPPTDEPTWRRRLLVVEDEPLAANLLRNALDGRSFDVETARSVADARAALDRFDPDVVLADINLGAGPTGIDLAHIVSRERPGVGIVIMTRYPDLPSAGYDEDDLPAGAGFVRKDAIEDPEALIAAIDTVLAEQPHQVRQDRDPDRPLGELTAAQVEVLRMMAQGYDNGAIAERRACSRSSIENLCAEIYRRLGIASRGDLNPRVEAIRVYIDAIGVPERDLT